MRDDGGEGVGSGELEAEALGQAKCSVLLKLLVFEPCTTLLPR